ncbi:MAG: hypothetical protein R3F30_10180 [Planctomycetota bacterium]
MRISARYGLATLGLALATLATPVQAQDFKRSLPPGTLLYVGAPDLDSAMESFKTSAMYKIWQEEEVQEFLEGGMQKLAQLYEGGLAQAKQMHQAGMLPVDPDEILKIRLKGLHMAVTGVNMQGEAGPEVGMVLALDFGDTAKTVKSLLSVLVNMARAQAGGPEISAEKVGEVELWRITGPGAPPDMGLHWAIVGNRLLLGTSQNGMKELIASEVKGGREQNLSNEEVYRSVAAKTRPGQNGIECYFRVDQIFELAIQGVAMAQAMGAPLPVDLEGVRRALDASGLAGLQAMGCSSAHEDGKGVDRYFAKLKGEPKGLMAMGGGKIDLELLKLVPKEAVQFTLGTFNPTALYDGILGAVRAYDEKVGELADTQIKGLSEQLGIDFRGDLFANLGGTTLYYQMPVAGMELPEMGIFTQVKDPAKALLAMQTICQLTEGAAEIREKKLEGGTLYSLDLNLNDGGMGMLQFEPTFTFKDGWMIAGLNQGDVMSALKMMSGEGGEDIRKNKAFAPYLEQIPQGVASVTFTDQVASFESLYGMLSSVVGFIPMPPDVPIDLGLLPSTECITKHLFGSMSYGIKMGDGFYGKAVGPMGPELWLAVGVAGAALVPAMLAMRANAPFPVGGAGGRFREARKAQKEEVEEEVVEEPVLQDAEPAPTQKK